MSVYKLIPSHYVTLHRDVKPLPPPPPCTAEQFENLKLLLLSSNSKLASLATTIKELRAQVRDRDATIAALTAAAATRVSTVVDNHVEVVHTRQPQDVVVDVTSDIQVRLKVELVDRGAAPPVIKVASTVVTRRSTGSAPEPPGSATAAGAEPTYTPRASSASSGGPGPVRSGYQGAHATASPLYGSLMWRTRQRAKELGYRFVWSRYGKILVKKDVQAPPIYILEESDLRKMV